VALVARTAQQRQRVAHEPASPSQFGVCCVVLVCKATEHRCEQWREVIGQLTNAQPDRLEDIEQPCRFDGRQGVLCKLCA